MAEDKIKREKIKKKSKEIEENIYAMNFDFDENVEEMTEVEGNVYDIREGLEISENEEQKTEEMSNQKKKMKKIEEGIKSSKIGTKTPRKTRTKTATRTATKEKTAKINRQSQIKMYTENNLTEVKLKENIYKIELQKDEYNIYTEPSETSYIIVREPSLRMVAGTAYVVLERKEDEYCVTTNQDFKINYVIDNLERKNKIVNFKLSNLTQIEADEDGLVFEIDEDKVIENSLEDNNMLIISEEDGKVYLPYTKDEIKEEITQNKGVKIGDLIEDKYIIPLDKYKNSMKARFREGYNLMYKREHKSRKSAILLGLELMFETNLHPAIISACKTLEELDIYLDCLEDNELEKFSCFKIIYKSLPTLRKSRRNEGF